MYNLNATLFNQVSILSKTMMTVVQNRQGWKIDRPAESVIELKTWSALANMNSINYTHFQVQRPLTYITSSTPIGTHDPGPSSEDRGYPAEKRSYALQKDEPIVEMWNRSIRAFTKNLLKAHSACWSAIDVFRRGYSFESCSTTIIITVPSLGNHECQRFQINRSASLDPFWVKISLEVFHECRQQGVDINVELIEGEINRFVMTQSDTICSMGDSIGVRDKLETGTLGGFMSIEDRKTPVLALTCHHVLSRSTAPLEKHSLVVNSPSDSDNQNQCQNMELSLKVYATQIDDLRKRMRHGMVSSNQESKMTKMMQNMTQLESCLKVSRERSRNFGRCFASSGNRIGPEGYSLDWALIDVTVPCVFDNKPPNIDVPISVRPSANKIIKLEMNERVYKFGKSTKFTEGVYNHIESDVNLPGNPGSSIERCIVSAASFSTLGDSGAWVLDEGFKLGGMVIGGNRNANCTYFTAINEIIEDVAEQTGLKVKPIDKNED